MNLLSLLLSSICCVAKVMCWYYYDEYNKPVLNSFVALAAGFNKTPYGSKNHNICHICPARASTLLSNRSLSLPNLLGYVGG